MFASSSSVYGQSSNLPFREDAKKLPISPYGVTKLSAEHYVRVYAEIHDIPAVSLRYFTVYGPKMRPDLAISIFARRALKDEEIEIFGDGEQTRDFTYIDDVIKAQNICLEKRIGNGEAYNIGSGKQISINELVEEIIEITDSKSQVVHTEPRKGDMRHTWADISKAEKELKWEPKITLEEGLKRYIKWLNSQ